MSEEPRRQRRSGSAGAGPDAHGDLFFTEEGRVLQIERAEAATRLGAPIVGLVFDRGVLLAAKYHAIGGDHLPAFLGRDSSGLRGGKLLRLGSRLGMAGVGLAGDFAAAGRHMSGRRYRSTQEAVNDLGDFFWRHSMRRDLRRLATMVFLGSTLDGEPRLFQFSPSGSVHEYVAWAWGSGAERSQKHLAEEYRPGSEREARKVALRELGSPPVYETLVLKV